MEEEIIPGLPDDVSVRCLAMISHGFHGVLQTVCKKWKAVLRSRYYANVKEAMGRSGDWLFVLPEPESQTVRPPHWIAYDPASNTWHPLPPLHISLSHISHRNFSCISVNGRFLVMGGTYSIPYGYHVTDSVFQFDPYSKQWTLLASMLSPRANFACAVVAGKVIVAGGWNANSSSHWGLSSAEIYDPIADTWEELPAMPNPLSYCMGMSVADYLYVFSELEEHPLQPSTSLVFDPAAGFWRTEARSLPFPAPLEFGIVKMQDQKQYAISTRGLSVIKSCGYTDDKWALVACLPPVAVPGHRQPLEAFRFSVVALRESLYVLGGNAIRYQRRDMALSKTVTLNSVRACNPNVRPLQWRNLKPMCGNAAGILIACGSLAEGQI